MTFKRTVHRLLAPFIYRDGTALVPAAAGFEWAQRQFLRRVLERLQADCVIDVGANEGQYAHELRLIGYRGLILSFEPAPDSFRRLSKASAADPRWLVFSEALGSEAGERRLNVMRASVLNSFREPSNQETDYAAYYNQVIERVDVKVERLDRILPRLRHAYGFARPFLKIDTQGFDLEVFRGAAGIHTTLVGVQSEIAIRRLYENVPTWTDVINEYTSADFELVGLFPVNPRERLLVECDCYFERAKRAA